MILKVLIDFIKPLVERENEDPFVKKKHAFIVVDKFQ